MAGFGKTVMGISVVTLAVLGIFFLWDGVGEETKLVFQPPQTESTGLPVYPLAQEKITLPVTFPGTKLTAQALALYEGPFAEDGSGDNVTNVAALILHNAGDTGIAYAEVELTLEGQRYCFVLTCLPPGGKVLVPEVNRKVFQEGAVTDCRCVKLVKGDFGLAPDRIRVTQKGMAGVVLENTAGQTLQNVCLHYKLYVNAQDIYVGGITYRFPVGTLSAGQRLEVIPEHFVWGYSAIVGISTGEE